MSGIYLLKPDGSETPVQAWCEQDVDRGGWTVIQRRKDGSVNFFRNWDSYKVAMLEVLILVNQSVKGFRRTLSLLFSTPEGLW